MVVTAEEEVVDGSGEVGRGGGVARSRSRFPESFLKSVVLNVIIFGP